MNPHAAEFVPGHPWVPNGLYPVSPNGYLASSNGIPVSPNGYPLSPNATPGSPNGFQPSSNGVPVTQNWVPVSPVSPVESPTVLTVEIRDENETQVVAEDNTEKSPVDVGNSNESIEQKASEVQCPDDEECRPETEENPGDPDVAVGGVVVENGSS